MDQEQRVTVVSSQTRRKTLFCEQHVGNRIVAKIIPVFLVGAAGFTTWVYTAQICGKPFEPPETKILVNFLIIKHHNTGLGGIVSSLSQFLISKRDLLQSM